MPRRPGWRRKQRPKRRSKRPLTIMCPEPVCIASVAGPGESAECDQCGGVLLVADLIGGTDTDTEGAA